MREEELRQDDAVGTSTIVWCARSLSRFQESVFLSNARFAATSAECWNLSAQMGANTRTILACSASLTCFSAVLPSVHPPQLNPIIIVATAPTAAPCSRRVSDSPRRIEGSCMVVPFARHVPEQSTGYPDGFRFCKLNPSPNAL